MIDNITTLTDAQAIAKFGGKYEKQIRENTSETLLNSVTLDGFLYGVPFTTNTWFMYYDKRVFPEKDIKSLEKMLEKEYIDNWYTCFAAGAVLISIPIAALFMYLQMYYVDGLTGRCQRMKNP